MKRKKTTPAPKQPKRRLLSCLVLLFVACGVIFLLASRSPRPTRVAATSTSVAAAATVTDFQAAPTATMTRTAISTVAPSVTPSATITAVAQFRTVPEMHITPLPNVPLMLVIQPANARSCPSTTCEVLFRLDSGETFGADAIVVSEAVNGNSQWYQTKMGLGRQVAYIHSSLVVDYDSAAQPTSAPARAAQPSTFRPDNCADAIAAGLTAEQAGQWPHLDRDGDGVACYGD